MPADPLDEYLTPEAAARIRAAEMQTILGGSMTQQTGCADCGAPETYTRDGVTYTVEHTDAVVGELATRWTRRGAQKLADESNVTRRSMGVRYEVRHAGFLRWQVIALQNRLLPPGAAPDRTEVRHRHLFDQAEANINASLGLPRAWRCACGGRPFEGKACPRCGATES